MLPTPSTAHVDINRIYDPAEDSYLLLDTISAPTEIEFLNRRFNSGHASTLVTPLVVEVGPGSGVILAFITANAKTLFGRTDLITSGVDINEYACQATVETVKRACMSSTAVCGTFLGAIRGDLTASLRPGSVDVLVFNPPYVPTSELPTAEYPKSKDGFVTHAKHETFSEDSHLLSLSFAGGKDGMEVTNRLLEQLPYALSMNGVAYLLLCRQNKPEEVISRIRAWGAHWAVETVRRSGKAAGWEKLQVIRIWRVLIAGDT
ncbi:S-adenosylmethionine-dependent methyltransferase [Lambiella insularis]|nr:S-adenosylmethionine-dependent methyltransferase [Lambiella insularis]